MSIPAVAQNVPDRFERFNKYKYPREVINLDAGSSGELSFVDEYLLASMGEREKVRSQMSPEALTQLEMLLMNYDWSLKPTRVSSIDRALLELGTGSAHFWATYANANLPKKTRVTAGISRQLLEKVSRHHIRQIDVHRPKQIAIYGDIIRALDVQVLPAGSGPSRSLRLTYIPLGSTHRVYQDQMISKDAAEEINRFRAAHCHK